MCGWVGVKVGPQMFMIYSSTFKCFTSEEAALFSLSTHYDSGVFFVHRMIDLVLRDLIGLRYQYIQSQTAYIDIYLFMTKGDSWRHFK